MNILLNNRIVPRESFSLDLEDRGFQFGDGIYEVIRIYDGILFEWEAHLERLVRSAKELMIPLPIPVNTLYQNLQLLVRDSEITDGSVYLQITRGSAPRFHAFPEKTDPTLVAYVREMQRPLEKMKKGIKVITAEDIRWLRVDIKSLNLLGNVLARQKAVEKGAGEAILIRDGMVTEGSSSNVFAIKGNHCFTHPANHLILNGITRQVVLRLLKDTDLTLKETPITLGELLEMDEVFITNTGQEVCPVIQIDEFKIGKGTPGIYTRQLQFAFELLIGSVIPSST
ncbi:D-amino-acid transaminase [Neobacillus cucumis]|uniref:D-alanine aminotransferase n=1 Tax=Neobacillus cucumis TaxID=1740721 RepID=A0A2N5HSH5_9BACI|nr:D-amino-acid transaminase [Neobacillus cucumis]PLS08463.1 D-amino-acid transaminase [Neobacillus cucumis]